MKMILLINTAFPTEFETYYHLSPQLGLLAISSALKKASYEVLLIDPQFDENYKNKLKTVIAKGVLFVGMSVYMGPNLHNALMLSKYIKELDAEIPIVWGGPLATSSPQFCLENADVDYIVMGMGERTIVELSNKLSQGKDVTSVAHLSYRKRDIFMIGKTYFFDGDLDEFEFPDLQAWDYGIEKLGKIPILSSRGCPRNCAFCYNNTFSGRFKWYQRSSDNVLQEMLGWRDIFGINKFYFVDDNFLVNTKRAIEIFNNAFNNELEISQVLGHIDDFKPDIFELLRHNKVSHVGFSIESASTKIQKMLNKEINLDSIISLVEFVSQIGIEKITTNFMFGLPSETNQDISDSVALAVKIRAINPKVRMVPMIYTPQPADDILPQFPDWKNRIEFTADNLSKVDFSPNRSKYLAPELRPWMQQEDIEFIVDLTQAWFYHFDYHVRNSQHIDMPSIYSRNIRVAHLFKDIPFPGEILSAT